MSDREFKLLYNLLLVRAKKLNLGQLKRLVEISDSPQSLSSNVDYRSVKLVSAPMNKS